MLSNLLLPNHVPNKNETQWHHLFAVYINNLEITRMKNRDSLIFF